MAERMQRPGGERANATQPPPPPPAAEESKPATTEEAESYRNDLTELQDFRFAAKKRSASIRKLCALILTPIDEADKGQSRNQAIRQALLALVDEIAPGE